MKWIQERAHELGLSDADIARRAGLPKSTVSRIFRGMSRPRRATSDRIAEAMGLDVDDVATHLGASSKPRNEITDPRPSNFAGLSDDELRAAAEVLRYRLGEVKKEARGRRWSADALKEIGE